MFTYTCAEGTGLAAWAWFLGAKGTGAGGKGRESRRPHGASQCWSAFMLLTDVVLRLGLLCPPRRFWSHLRRRWRRKKCAAGSRWRRSVCRERRRRRRTGRPRSVGMYSVLGPCERGGCTIVGGRMVVFGRVVDGGERRGRSCRRPQVLAANLLLQVLDNQCGGDLLLVCIDRAVSADFRSCFLYHRNPFPSYSPRAISKSR